jgi:hypothetical protein
VASIIVTDVPDEVPGNLPPRKLRFVPNASDPDQAAGDFVAKFLWNFGDGTPVVESTGPVEHTFTTVGNFTVALVAIDSLGAQSATATHAIATRGTITGTVFEDDNGDGDKDTGENGIGGHTVFVDLNQNGALDEAEPTQATSNNGFYLLPEVGPGIHSVRVKPAGNAVATFPSTGHQPIDMSKTPQANGIHRGVFRLGSIEGLVFDDTNGNGDKAGNEPVITSRAVYLDLDNDNVHDPGEPTTTSHPTTGKYVFTQKVGPGSPVVRPVSLAPGQFVSNAGGAVDASLNSGGSLANRHLGRMALEIS